jgi:hypothetical protein
MSVGARQIPFTHTSFAQSAGTRHVSPVGHPAQTGPPQSTSVSPPFLTPSMQLGGTHLPDWQLSLMQSLPTPHESPFGHAGAPSLIGELEPPQSTSVSLSFLTPSVGEGAAHSPSLQTLL